MIIVVGAGDCAGRHDGRRAALGDDGKISPPFHDGIADDFLC